MPRDHLGNFNVSSDLAFARGVLLLDDCEGALVFGATGTGADFSCEKHADGAYYGDKGLVLKTRATDPAEDDVVNAVRFVPYGASGLLVTRMLVGLPDVSDVKDVTLYCNRKDGVAHYQSGITYRPNVPALYYRNSAGAIAEITGYDATVPDGQWFLMEVAVDLSEGQYVSCMVNGIESDLGGLEFYEVGASGERSLQLQITVKAAGANQATAYVDMIYAGEFLHL